MILDLQGSAPRRVVRGTRFYDGNFGVAKEWTLISTACVGSTAKRLWGGDVCASKHYSRMITRDLQQVKGGDPNQPLYILQGLRSRVALRSDLSLW